MASNRNRNHNAHGLTFEVIRENFKTLVRRTSDLVTDPAGDWPPLLLVEDEHGRINPRCLADYPMATVPQKNHLAEVVLPELVRQFGGRRVGLAFHGWVVTSDDDPSLGDYVEQDGSLANHPARSEWVTLLVVDADECEAWLAEVNRRPGRRPKLGPWSLSPAVPDGRFVEPLRWALSGVDAAPASNETGVYFAALAEVLGEQLAADEEWPRTLALRRGGDEVVIIDVEQLRQCQEVGHVDSTACVEASTEDLVRSVSSPRGH